MIVEIFGGGGGRVGRWAVVGVGVGVMGGEGRSSFLRRYHCTGEEGTPLLIINNYDKK